jgi:hypothetical protein
MMNAHIPLVAFFLTEEEKSRIFSSALLFLLVIVIPRLSERRASLLFHFPDVAANSRRVKNVLYDTFDFGLQKKPPLLLHFIGLTFILIMNSFSRLLGLRWSCGRARPGKTFILRAAYQIHRHVYIVHGFCTTTMFTLYKRNKMPSVE